MAEILSVDPLGSPAESSVVAKDPGDALAIFLSDDAQANEWILEIWADLTSGGQFLVGRMLTTRPADGDSLSRMVGTAWCPGVRNWRVRARGPANQTAQLYLATSAAVGQTKAGVQSTRSFPRDRALGLASQVVRTFDVSLVAAFGANRDPAVFAWLQFFNKTALPVAGDVPIVEIPVSGQAPFSLSEIDLNGEQAFSKGLVWGASSTGGIYTAAATLFDVTVVLG